MSKFTLASRPATISIATAPVSGTTIGRFERSCGAIGTTTQPRSRDAGSARRRERVRGRAGRRADDQAVGAQVGDEVAVDLDPQLDHPGGRAAADDHVVEREALEDASPSRSTWPSSIARCSSSCSPSRIAPRRRLVADEGDVGDEAEPALVDADERRAVAGELAGDAEHRAVAAEDDGDVAGGAERRGVERGPAAMPVFRAVSASIETERPRATRNFAIEPSSSRMPPELNFADERGVPEAGRHMRGITPQRPLFPRVKMVLLPCRRPCSTSAPRPC
jgi:hypothetical protein